MHLLQIGRAESARARSAHERRPLACDVVTHDSDGSDCQDGDDADQDRVFDQRCAGLVLRKTANMLDEFRHSLLLPQRLKLPGPSRSCEGRGETRDSHRTANRFRLNLMFKVSKR